MSEIDAWLEQQSARERRAVRLEDALLADRYGPYFFFRLRFFMARTAMAALLHAIRIVLLVSAFAIDEFLFFLVLTSTVALVADTWWGALESMRSRIRRLQRIGARYRAPAEIARWLRLSLWLGLAVLAAALVLLVAGIALVGELTPILVMSTAVVVGTSLNLVTRAYHSGAYAVRRVYRPLPSLLAADVLSLGLLLVLWPFLGSWAFAVAEVVTVLALVAISLWYTTRTYRSLAFPTLPTLLRRSEGLPSRTALRDAIAPAAAFGVVGLEALVLLAVLLAGGSASSVVLVALLAAVSPVIRAGFEWAHLMYFDMARLEVPLLAAMRRRFERAVAALSVVVGGITWLIAAVVGVVFIGVRNPLLVAVLLPFFIARSALAAAQMRAFTWRAYLRLFLTGLAAVVLFLIVVLALDGAVARVAGLTLALLTATATLVWLPVHRPRAERVVPPAQWLERLRELDGPVTVHRVGFDRRDLAHGVIPEERRKAAWMRDVVARRLAQRVQARAGQTTWLTPRTLAWFVPGSTADGVRADDLDLLGGLTAARPSTVVYDSGDEAALAMVPAHGASWSGDMRSMLRSFADRFPSGIAYDVRAPAPAGLDGLTSFDRAGVLRAALQHIQGGRVRPARGEWDVTASADAEGLRVIFMVPVSAPRSARRRWRQALDVHNRRVAAGALEARGAAGSQQAAFAD